MLDIIILRRLDEDYNDKLFHKATYRNYAMHHPFHSLKSSGYNLRTLGHGLCVNFIKSQHHKKHSLVEQYSLTVINSLCIVFLLCCVFSVPVLT